MRPIPKERAFPRPTARAGGWLLVAILAFAGCAQPEGESSEEKRSYIRRAQVHILEEAYTHRPAAQNLVHESAGYATFSSFDAKIVFLGTGNAYGLAVDRTTGKRTFMRMTRIEAGVGLGLQETDLLLVFRDRARFKAFVAGSWEWGGNAEATTASRRRGSSSVGVRGSFTGDPVVFQLSRSGAELAAGVGGYRFTRDADLN